MATAVTISIVVDSAQAQQAVAALNTTLAQTGTGATASFQKAGTAVQQLGGHVATNLDGVRLLSQEFGLRLPRAIEAMISRSQALSGAINGVIGGLAAVAGIEVFAHLVKGAYDLYNNYISLNAAADKYYETLKKTREADFGGARTIETQQQRYAQATQVASQLRQQAEDLHNKSVDEATNPNNLNLVAAGADALKARDLANQAAEAATQRDAAWKNGLELTHQQKAAQIELNHASDADLVGRTKINAETAKKIEMDKEGRRYAIDLEKASGNPAAADAGESEQRMKDAQARAEGRAQEVNLNREAALAMMKSHDEMVASKLRGEEQYQFNLQAIYRETYLAEVDAGKDGIVAKAAALAAQAKMEREHFDGQKRQMEEAQQELAKANMAGLSPAARADAELTIATTQNNDAFTDGHLSKEARDVKDQAAARERTNKLLALQEEFTDRVKALDDGRVANALRGYAKIDAEERKQIDAMNSQFNKTFGGALPQDPSTIAAKKATEDAITQIHTTSNVQRSELDVKNHDDTLRYEQQAAEAEKKVKEEGLLGFIAAYRNSIQAIDLVDSDRRKKVEEEFAAGQIKRDDANAREVALDREKNAQIAEQNMQLQHQIAGNLQQAFTNPVEYIKNAMEKMFFEIVASWIIKMDSFKAIFGNTLGSIGNGGSASSGGGILSAAAHGAGGASGTSNGGASGGGTIGSGSTSADGSGIGSTVSGIGSLAQTAANIPGLAGATGGSSAASAAGSVSTAAGALGAGLGAFTAAQSTVAAYKSGNVLQGALGDAAAGAAIGSVVPGVGTAIGAGIGAGIGTASGLLGMVGGEGRKLAARDYYNQSIFPTLNAAATNSNYGDFQTAISSANSTAAQALSYMRGKFGRDAADWVNDHYMKKELEKVDSMISNSAEGGRQFTQLSAMQFHSGGRITGFGNFATSSNEGFIHAAMDETVMTPGASRAHGPMLSAMNAGANASDIASAYLSRSGAGMPAQGGGSGGDTHFHIHTLDTRTMAGWLRNGGAKMITKHQNDYASQYAGDGIGG